MNTLADLINSGSLGGALGGRFAGLGSLPNTPESLQNASRYNSALQQGWCANFKLSDEILAQYRMSGEALAKWKRCERRLILVKMKAREIALRPDTDWRRWASYRGIRREIFEEARRILG